MRADSMMSRQVITIGVDAAIIDAIKTMLKQGVSGLPVVDQAGKLVGILSKSDFLRPVELPFSLAVGNLLLFQGGDHGNRLAQGGRFIESRGVEGFRYCIECQ